MIELFGLEFIYNLTLHTSTMDNPFIQLRIKKTKEGLFLRAEKIKLGIIIDKKKRISKLKNSKKAGAW